MASDRLPRKLAAILYADVVGYSRLTGEDEDATHRKLREYLDLVSEVIAHKRGCIVHYAGDAVLARFDAVIDALSGAVTIQNEVGTRNLDVPKDRQIQFRIGVNLGDIIEDQGDIYGDGVNVAARLESLADPGGICISESVHTAAGNKLPVEFKDIGEQSVKNISKAIRAYKVLVHSGEDSKISSSKNLASELRNKPSIAVLPFTNMSADSEQEYFADGITEDIVATLSQISAIFVPARNSSFVFKNKSVKVQDIARELGVRYVLEGSVRKSGERVRITAQLIDATDGGHLWAERYDRNLEDIFEIQDEIARNIAIELQVQLTSGDHARIWQTGTRNFEAWQSQIRGMQLFYEGTRESRVRAVELFEQAVKIDPDYTAAWKALGSMYAINARHGYASDRTASLEQAEKIAERLLKNGESEADGYNILANVRLSQRRFEEAVTAGRRSVELAPNNANHHGVLALILVFSGQPQQGLRHINIAMSLSPNYPNWFTQAVVLSHYLEDKFEVAREAAAQATIRFPDYLPGYVYLAGTCSALGLTEQARDATDEVLRRQPDFSLKEFIQRMFFQDPKHSLSWLQHLRRAGLPD